ncbi:flagellar motor protein MotA [Novimethylophilus kurashikiensis]|uniref:Probable membrane transporter protein n=1 Tax=Novimethylophilus kurashikiensis TaxID=1825523 RepID=A0A2R5F658_9PROT|nr:sulfite exporter TauE/SafE family protein [Novimethylophilus kurashikiensis]GBG13078.1 flagellar motor protein MotA [Novimethylophilus kurashikiensis]
MTTPYLLILLVIGLGAGVSSGIFGIGGGILIVPALMYWAKFSQHAAVGTSLAILLPPVGLAAVTEYYRSGNVDLKVAGIVAAGVLVGGWLGASIANQLNGHTLKLVFGLFVLLMGAYLTASAARAI